jgi:hypothetical protein
MFGVPQIPRTLPRSNKEVFLSPVVLFLDYKRKAGLGTGGFLQSAELLNDDRRARV